MYFLFCFYFVPCLFGSSRYGRICEVRRRPKCIREETRCLQTQVELIKPNRSSGQHQHLPRGFRHPHSVSGVRDMALSSGGWAPPAPVPASSQQVACGGPAPVACCSTVLMSVRVSVCHSGIRPLCLPGAGSEALRLQLSMDPSRAGEFRLALRDMSGNRSVVSPHTYTQ